MIKFSITDRYLNTQYPIILEISKKDELLNDEYNPLYDGVFRINNIYKFIMDVLNEGYNYNCVGFDFGPIIEGGKIWVDADMVEFYFYDVKKLYTKVEVLEFTLELARKSLDAVNVLGLKEKGLVDIDWIEYIENSIPLLNKKLDQCKEMYSEKTITNFIKEKSNSDTIIKNKEDGKNMFKKENTTIDNKTEIETKPNTINYNNILEIAEAFQIASGQSYAIQNTIKLLELIKKYGNIEVVSLDNSLILLSTPVELREYILSLDSNIDIKDLDF